MRPVNFIVCSVALLSMAPASMISAASAMPCCLEHLQLTPELMSGLQEQFDAVPAVGITAAMPDAHCRAPVVVPDPHIVAWCSVAVTCGSGDYFSFYLLSDGQVFAPKGLGRLLAEDCPENISDPVMRDALVKDYQDELQSLGAWLHGGLDK